MEEVLSQSCTVQLIEEGRRLHLSQKKTLKLKVLACESDNLKDLGSSVLDF